MDFTFSEEQQAVADLTDQIMADRLDSERLLLIESGDEWFDRDLWADLAGAGLVGIAIADDLGGGGLDAVAMAILLRAQGNHVAPLPLLPTCVASMAIDRHGTDEQRQRLLPDVTSGSASLSVALCEPADDRVRTPSTLYDGASLSGTKILVESADTSTTAVVTADSDDGPGLFLVDLHGPGVSSAATVSTRGEPISRVAFSGAPAEPLGRAGAGTVDWLVDHMLLGTCATQLGVTERALELTARYTSTREQFGRPIATFQAVTQRLADQFINVGGIRLTTLVAAWRLAEGLDASEDLLIAKWWASERATEVAHATQHCHGGIGVARDYPLHRYTLWNRHLTASLGAGSQTLLSLGNLLATR